MTHDGSRPEQLDDARWEALARYLAGESSPDEQAEVRNWIDEDPSRQEWMGGLDRALSSLEEPLDVDVDAGLDRVLARIQTADIVHLSSRVRPRASTFQRVALALAATVILVLGAGWLYQQLTMPSAPIAAVQTIFESTVGEP